MKLKKLELCGFKTFPLPTELVFHDGITAIVGPNGCGKSNVIDAIRWVMGETSAKGLRGDSMEDVIFSGSDARKATNLAEVTLTLAEAQGALPDRFGAYHEVAITRRLDRSGESDYFINKIPCRLKDITELFMDTGLGRRAYSVVEQGRIDAILSAKPRDRRFLIEEAAGITKYKSRKDEAVRRMEQTSQNLERLGDVIGEVRREMNALKRQAARAEAFKALRGEKRRLERDLLVAAWLDLGLRRGEAEERLARRQEEAAAARARSDGLGARLETGRLRLLDEERALEARQRGVYHLRSQITERESRLGFLDREIQGMVARAAQARGEAGEAEARAAALAAELAALAEERRQVAARIEGRAGVVAALAAEHREAVGREADFAAALERERRGVLAALGELTRNGHGLDHARRQREEALRRLEGMGRHQADVAAKLRDLEAETLGRGAELAAAEGARDELRRERAALEEAVKAARSRRAGRAREVEEARRGLSTDQSRLQGLEQLRDSREGYGAGVRAVLEDARRTGQNGVHGVVADAIAAPAEYEAALEAALGERLQSVIVAGGARAVAAVGHLKAKRAGRATFAPLGLRAAAPIASPAGAGSRGRLLDLVEVAPAYVQLAQGLLADVYVVETLEQALGLWEGGAGATLVTLGGEAVSPAGVISGGVGKGDGAGLLRQSREIRELRQGVAARAAAVVGLEAGLAELDGEIEALGARLEEARDEGHRRDLQVVHLAKDLAQLRERRERLEERREALELEREDLGEAAERFGGEVARLEAERVGLAAAQGEAEARVAAVTEAVARAREEVRAAQAVLTRHQVEDAGDRQRQEGLAERLRAGSTSREHVVRRAEKLRGEGAELEGALGGKGEELARVRRELEVLGVELGRQEAGVGELATRLDGVRGELTAEEKAAAQARREGDEAARRLNEAELGARELELMGHALAERCRERLAVDLGAEATAGTSEGFDPAVAEARVRVLEAELAGFGEINLLAIEEFADRKERFEFLETQRRDLEESLAALKQAIARINRVSRERFAETFEKVRDTFRDLFPQLFRGGEAELLLTDADDLLETGVEIVARPPGKRPQHIGLLSGGEKALTAVALIFAIFLVKPSPFCILDEVDAPLDEANIGRFSELLRTMAGASQFLLITHNKSTMEAADHLYGVTMGEPGMSKIVSVRLTEERPAEAA